MKCTTLRNAVKTASSVALFLLPMVSVGQSLKFNMSDGTTNSFVLAQVDSVVFSDETDVNLWEMSDVTTSFYYAPNWSQIANPAMTKSGNTYTMKLPHATYAQWQAQVFFNTDLSTSAQYQYDFEVTLTSDKSVNQATVKLYQAGNDNLYFFADRVNLKAGVPYVFGKKNMDGLDISKLNLVLDFGGNSAATTVRISELSLVARPFNGGPDMEDYKLVWSDEFETSSINPFKWTHQVASSGWVNHELQNYVKHRTPGGQLVTEGRDGKLMINCFKEGDKVYSGRLYGNVSTGFQYCYIEARIKLPKGKGTWPAFWMMPVNGGNWPDCGEIDIMEEVGTDPNRVSSSIHCKAYNHPMKTQKTHEMYCATAEGEFHVYAMEWTADYIQTYVDGRKQLYFPNDGKGNVETWPFNKPFYPILNLAWGGDWGGYKGVDESALPVTMEVDYIRIYQKK